VLGPDGKPCSGAKVYTMAAYTEPVERAKTGADGRFEFLLRRGEVVGSDKQPARNFQIVADAEGHGPAWMTAHAGAPPGPVTLRLVKDAAMEGPTLTQEGKPVAGATIRIGTIGTSAYGQMVMGGGGPLYGRSPQQPRTITADDDGKFRLTGVGRGRIV